MFIIYNLIYLFAAMIYVPYLLLKRKWHKDFPTRLGFIDTRRFEQLKKTKNVWVHAVSVGEVLAIVGLIKALQKEYPNLHFIISTVTQTGNSLAQKHFPECTVIYAPLDFSWVVKKIIRLITPLLYLSAETEIWPNLYSRLAAEKVPILQVNGRISDKAFIGYKRYRILIKKALRAVSVFCVQSQIDADRMIHLGASLESIKIVGNLKFDFQLPEEPFDKALLGYQPEDVILTAGSTHPGEEQIAIDTYRKLVKDFSALKLVLVPRHIERVSEVEMLLKENQLSFQKISEYKEGEVKERSVLLVDTIGQLRQIYSISDIVFIGKTFKVGGGQNMIEPLYFGKPTFVGPLTQNFKSVMQIFLKEEVIYQVDTPESLTEKMKEILLDKKGQEAFADKARSVINQYKGAQEKTLREIRRYLKA